MLFSPFWKRSWRLLQDVTKTICRALGLNLLLSLFNFVRHQAVGKGCTEQTKIAIRRSRTTALLRALIHVIPVSVALWEVVLNWNTYFVGYDVYEQVYYQLGAKAHEIAVQASLSAVIFSYVRYELMLGDGIPFGALFSGLQVSQASYLWSMEFWGTICSKNGSFASRLRLLVVVAASIFLAAVAGPSSVILLLPRLDYWPAGSTSVWMNITAEDLWPARTQVADVLVACLDAGGSNIDSFACPSHGWEAIQHFIHTSVNSLEPKYLDLLHMVDTPDWVEVNNYGSRRRVSIKVYPGASADGFDPGVDWAPTVATTPQSTIADTLTEIGVLWDHVVSNVSTRGHGQVLQRQAAVHAIKRDYYQPYSVITCANDFIDGPYDERAVTFPAPAAVRLSMLQDQAERNDSILGRYSFQFPGITRDQILGTPGSVEENRLKWVELPQDPFNGSAIGAVILLPRSISNSTQEIIVCNLGAGWGSSSINASSFGLGTSAVMSAIDFSTIGRQSPKLSNTDTSHIDQEYTPVSKAEGIAGASSGYYDLPFFPQKPIIVTEAWARHLNLFIAALNTTMINALMTTNRPSQELSPRQQRRTAEWALVGLLVNGLASIGANSKLQGNMRTVVGSDGSRHMDGGYWFSGKGDMFIVDPEESKHWVKFRVESTINGYAYNIRGTAPKMAISLLLAYCIIALSHALYAGISGISSTCWDSIGEVTALAMNSTPTVLLRNTCAGIMELNIYKLPVRVLAIRDSEGDGDHLELVFGNTDGKEVGGTPITPNRVYGTLPKLAKVEKSE